MTNLLMIEQLFKSDRFIIEQFIDWLIKNNEKAELIDFYVLYMTKIEGLDYMFCRKKAELYRSFRKKEEKNKQYEYIEAISSEDEEILAQEMCEIYKSYRYIEAMSNENGKILAQEMYEIYKAKCLLGNLHQS